MKKLKKIAEETLREMPVSPNAQNPQIISQMLKGMNVETMAQAFQLLAKQEKETEKKGIYQSVGQLLQNLSKTST